jgi:acetyltransferase-like isoleucine patch superfamily enzyme
MLIFKFIGFILYKIDGLLTRFINFYLVRNFKKIGKNCHIEGKGVFSNNIYLGNNVYIGPNCIFIAKEKPILIGSNVMFGPNVLIATGNHNVESKTSPMFLVKEKLPQNDSQVVIEDDVWVGMGAIILKGVNIGKGSIIGAGTIVLNNVPPYSIITSDLHNKVRERN